MVPTYRLTTITEAVEIAVTLSHSWFRGHATVVGELTPRIWRPDIPHESLFGSRPALELEIIDTFKRESPTLPDVPLPAADDNLGWLYVMQHYRAPTRLLDWTENLLVALHFVVSDSEDQDGELWAMYPLALNKVAHVGWGMPLLKNNPVLQYLVHQPYWAGKDDDLAKSYNMNVVPNKPIAFKPSKRFARLVRQAGAFTIHPPPEQGHKIPEILTEAEHLVRYVVPANVKRRLRAALIALGIDDYTLFPELEGLSRRIEDEMRVVAYTPPTPPKCGGPV